MARIIPLHGDDHQQIRLLLPWYVTGRLDALEHARVEAHLASCDECQADLRFEQRLEAEVAELPIEVDRSWAQMRSRIAERSGKGRRFAAPWVWGAIAAQVVVVAALAALTFGRLQTPRYHALGGAPAEQPGEIILLVSPDTPERELRRILETAEVRIVNGPTAAGAYVLQAPDSAALALQRLRREPQVTLAEPIGAGKDR